jgi:hypothetical protein
MYYSLIKIKGVEPQNREQLFQLQLVVARLNEAGFELIDVVILRERCLKVVVYAFEQSVHVALLG